jgi:hypothetical protein
MIVSQHCRHNISGPYFDDSLQTGVFFDDIYTLYVGVLCVLLCVVMFDDIYTLYGARWCVPRMN